MEELYISSPNRSRRAKGLEDVWGVICHATVSAPNSAVAVAKYFANPASQVSAHVVIDASGLVVHCVSIEKAAWQAGLCRRYDWDRDGKLEEWEQYANAHTIGIEFCNPNDNKTPFPNAQILSAAELIRRWDKRCPNLKLRDITDHQAVNLLGKSDVKPNFPAAKLFWFILHPEALKAPGDAYQKLPKWAQRQVDEIKK